MTFKLNKRNLFTVLLAAVAAVCMALAISFLIPSSRTLTASADSSSHSSHNSWNQLTSSTSTLTSGNYYLSGNVSVNITVSSGDVTLCLNGKTLKPKSSGSAVIIIKGGASLTLCDCSSGGQITGTTKSSGYGAGVFVNSGAKFTMESGTITGNSAKYGGGVYVEGTFVMNGGTISNNKATGSDGEGGGSGVYVKDGTFTMNGGYISGNTSSYWGGGVYLEGDSTFDMYYGTISSNDATGTTVGGGGVYVGNGTTFTMYDGTISNNTTGTTSNGGGGVCVAGTFNMKGGTISGNTATTSSACGGGVFVTGSGNFTMSGGTISENKAVHCGGVYTYGYFTMTGGTISGNTATNGNGGGVFVQGGNGEFNMSDGYVADGVYSENSGKISITGGYFSSTASSTISSCLSGYRVVSTNDTNWPCAVVSGTSAHTHDSVTFSTALVVGGTLSGGGKYFLATDVNLDTGITVSSGTVYLCLNGHTLTGASGSSVITVNGGKLILCDCDSFGYGKITGGSTSNGGGVCVNGGTFTMKSGVISSNTASKNGGGVYVSSSGTFNMSGGTISSNNANGGGDGNGGGGVYVNGGTFTMSGGTISGNTATYAGGGVCMYSSGTFNMTGGTISGNQAKHGGGVQVYGDGTFTLSSNGEIKTNTATINAGGVSVSGTFNMKGGTISGNKATSGEGGGIRVNGGAKVAVSSGTITGNEAKDGGGVYVNSNSATLTISGGTISSNKASGNGGGVCVNGGGILTMTGGDITGNEASGNGGGVYSCGTFTMSDESAISENKATSGNGGGVDVSSKGTFTMKNGTISENSANYGGGVCLESGTFAMSGGTISDNSASSGNGVYVGGSSSTFIMTGGNLTDDVYINGGEVTISGGYFSESAYKSVESYIDEDSVGVHLVDFATAYSSVYSSGRSKRSAEGYTYAVYSDGNYDIDDIDVTYGDKYEVKVGNACGEVYIIYTWCEENTNCLTLPTRAGEYKVTATIISVSDASSVCAGIVEFTITIERKSLTDDMFCVTDGGYTYDGKEHKAGYTCKVGLSEGSDYTVTYSSDIINAGTVTITFKGQGNYCGTVELTYVIAKASYNMDGVSLSGGTVTYDGSAHSLVISGKLPDGVTVTYYYLSEDGTTYTAEAPVNAGTYTVIAVFSGDYNNYNEISSMTATLTIKKATLSVEDVTDVTASVGDSLEDIELPEGWSWEGTTTFTEAGEYEVEATYSAGDNYETVTTTITVSVMGLESALSDGEIAGIISAGAVFVILVAVLIVFVLIRKEEVEE